MRFSPLALQLLGTMKSKETEARTLTTMFLLVNHCRQPLKEGTPAFERAYRSGLRNNDTSFAFLAAIGIAGTAYHSGRPLGKIKTKARGFVSQMKAFNCNNSTFPMLQFAMCMQGGTEDSGVAQRRSNGRGTNEKQCN